jgi:hypothetical protein
MPNGERDEIQVTPEMVEAGVRAFYLDYQPAFESASEAVEKIFRAMINVCHQPSDGASRPAQ